MLRNYFLSEYFKAVLDAEWLLVISSSFLVTKLYLMLSCGEQQGLHN